MEHDGTHMLAFCLVLSICMNCPCRRNIQSTPGISCGGLRDGLGQFRVQSKRFPLISLKYSLSSSMLLVMSPSAIFQMHIQAGTSLLANMDLVH